MGIEIIGSQRAVLLHTDDTLTLVNGEEDLRSHIPIGTSVLLTLDEFAEASKDCPIHENLNEFIRRDAGWID